MFALVTTAALMRDHAHDPSRNIVILTGAGVSDESSLATFRGPRGLWEGTKAMKPAYLHLRPNEDLPPIPRRSSRIVIVADEVVCDAWMDKVAAWLVQAGCLYAVAWGTACEAWHDSVDRAALEACNHADSPNEQFVMTTWHATESLADAFWFAAQCAFHPTVDLVATIIVHIAYEGRAQEVLKIFADRQDLAGDA